MDVLTLHRRAVERYQEYIRSFIEIHDADIRAEVTEQLDSGKLCREPDLAKRLDILKDAILGSSGLPLPVEIVGLDERNPDDKERRRDHLLEEAGLKELQRICVGKIRQAAGTQEFLQHPRLLTFLFKWFHWGAKAEVRAWLAGRCKDEKGAVWLLRTLLLKSSSSGMQGTRIHHRIDLRVVAQFSDVALSRTGYRIDASYQVGRPARTRQNWPHGISQGVEAPSKRKAL